MVTAACRDAASRFEAIVDPRVGIIAAVAETARLPGEPDFSMVTARLAAVDRVFSIAGFNPVAAGTALDALEARVRACGEAAERYAAFLFLPDAGLRAAYAELPGRGISPAHWPRCTPDAYALPANPLVPPDPARVYDWVQGWSLSAGEPVFVPAGQVCLGYVPRDRAELANLPHSTGLAVGRTLDAASLSGLCEVLERDAFTLTWSKQLPAHPILVPATGWPDVRERIGRVARRGLEVQLYAMLVDEPPVKVLALILDRTGGPVPIVCGLGAAPDAQRAVAKAVDEAVQSRRVLLAMTSESTIRVPQSPTEVISLPDHLTYYLNPDRLKAFEFLRSAAVVPGDALPSLSGDDTVILNLLVRQLGEQGYETVRVDITPPDLAVAEFRAVRVIVPGMIPLTHGYAMQFLDCPRWRKFPGELNAAPHPFG